MSERKKMNCESTEEREKMKRSKNLNTDEIVSEGGLSSRILVSDRVSYNNLEDERAKKTDFRDGREKGHTGDSHSELTG